MDENLQCQICPYKAPRMIRLKRHMVVTHQGMRLSCEMCKYTSAESSNLKKHIQRVHEGLRFTCNHCNKIFCEKGRLEKHIAHVHLNKPREIFPCNECGKEFLSKINYVMHNDSHLGISHACEKCDYKTTYKVNLKNHIKSNHMERKWHFCKSCDYKGTQKGLRRRLFGFTENQNMDQKVLSVTYVSMFQQGMST